MSNDENSKTNVAPTPEELKQEEELTREVSVEDVQAQVIEQYGLDGEEQSELIEKITNDRVESQKNLSKAIGQKVSWRDKANAPADVAEIVKPVETKDSAPDVTSQIHEALENERLADLDVPEDVKPQIKKLAELNGTSVREAAKDPYIASLVNSTERKQTNDKASISSTNKSTSVQFDAEAPPEVDMSTEEGQKAHAEWRKEAQARHNANA